MSNPFAFDTAPTTPEPRRPRRPHPEQPGSTWPLSARVLVWLLLVVVSTGLFCGVLAVIYHTVERQQAQQMKEHGDLRELELLRFDQLSLLDADKPSLRAERAEVIAALHEIHGWMRQRGIQPARKIPSE